MVGKFFTGNLNRALVNSKRLVVSIVLAAALLVAAACQPYQTREVDVTREVEVTREVPVTRQVEVTREVPVTRQVEVTRKVPVTRQVEVTREVPVTRQVEVTREIQVERQIPVTPQATETPLSKQPTSTPTNNLTITDRAELWIALYDGGYSSSRIKAKANPAFDVDEFDLKVTVRAGRLSETFFNTQKIYGGNGTYRLGEYFDLSQSLEKDLSSVIEVSAQTTHGSLSCERDKRSNATVLTYACGWRK